MTPDVPKPSHRFRSSRALRLAALLATTGLGALALLPHEAVGFTQSGAASKVGDGIPMGHEWLTRLAALELLGYAPEATDDPRKHWTAGLAGMTDLSKAQTEVNRIKGLTTSENRYKSMFQPVLSAVVGERWVDIGGFNVSKGRLPGGYDCFDAVAQEPVDIQWDHFMRRWDEVGPDGAISAIRNSRNRFINHFIRAATAPAGNIKVYDGGAYSAETEVDRNYFYFGRALHLLQDSFSPEHTVRVKDDQYKLVRQVKSYLCAAGAEQHSHNTPSAVNYNGNRDVIWKDTAGGAGWSSYKASAMAEPALVAVEATKDAWAAFIRVMAITDPTQRKAEAQREAVNVANGWMYFQESEVRGWYGDAKHRDATYVKLPSDTGPGKAPDLCLRELGVKSGRVADKLAELEEAQKACIYNLEEKDAVNSPDRDPSLHIPYYWQWKTTVRWLPVPPGYQIPTH